MEKFREKLWKLWNHWPAALFLAILASIAICTMLFTYNVGLRNGADEAFDLAEEFFKEEIAECDLRCKNFIETECAVIPRAEQQKRMNKKLREKFK